MYQLFATELSNCPSFVPLPISTSPASNENIFFAAFSPFFFPLSHSIRNSFSLPFEASRNRSFHRETSNFLADNSKPYPRNIPDYTFLPELSSRLFLNFFLSITPSIIINISRQSKKNSHTSYTVQSIPRV